MKKNRFTEEQIVKALQALDQHREVGVSMPPGTFESGNMAA